MGGTHLSGASSEFLKRIFRILARTRPSVGVAEELRIKTSTALGIKPAAGIRTSTDTDADGIVSAWAPPGPEIRLDAPSSSSAQ